ncbi:hunchback-like protein [Leptotrombidium deliense]|uniref:Protein hunchback n=1 Tax=Leptotrombidium deliense TaxID=299467 RepID=A0A443SUH8_9ACAR|nr:hunchback-like protein [Leptotrombidium deliense]
MSAISWNYFGNERVEVIASAKENCGRTVNDNELANDSQHLSNTLNGEQSNGRSNSHRLKSPHEESSAEEDDDNELDGYEFDEEDEEADIDNDSCPSPDEMYATSCTSPVGDENSGNFDDRKGDKDYGSSFRGHHLLENPILQLQSALGMKLKEMNGCPANAITNSLFNGILSNQSAGNSSLTHFNKDDDISGELYRCHLCSYTGNSQQHFNLHMNTHFDHKCPYCDYTSRTEGRLKKHIRDFHSEIPPESWAGTRVPRNIEGTNENSVTSDGGSTGNGNAVSHGSGKSRKYKCKQCNFIAMSKSDFWDHSKGHIKAEKLLTCPKCQFVTEYKHHLEYHLRNHFGSKPFKCAKCNYSCVNKSMLNSHMKSHSNIYQYRCSDCSYATKYCHSLKLHLRKYSHKPATVLNLDGTPNPYPIIDVYGTRRGPRPKKRQKSKSPMKDCRPKTPPVSTNSDFPLLPNTVSAINFLENPTSIPPLIPSTMPMGLPFLYPPLFPNGLLGSPALANVTSPSGLLFPPTISHPFNSLPDTPNSMSSPLMTTSEIANESNVKHAKEEKRHSSGNHIVPLKCSFCDFTTEVRELYGKHLVLHVAAENEEMPNMQSPSFKCGINFLSKSEIEEQQKALFNELMARQSSSPNSRKLLEQITSNPVAANVLFSGCSNLSRPEVSRSSPPPKAMETQDVNDVESSEASNVERRAISAPVDLNVDLRELFSPPPRAKSSPCLFTPSLTLSERNEELPAVSKLMISMSDDVSPLDLSSNRNSPPSAATKTMQTNDEKRLNAINDCFNRDQEQSRHNRRKGKAVKLDRMCIKIDENVAKEKHNETRWKEHICTFCDIAFKDVVMYSMHMAYHGYCDPFTCKMCGHRSSDKVSFFLHIARTAHM